MQLSPTRTESVSYSMTQAESLTVVSDAIATFGRVGYDGASYTADHIHQVNLVSLDGEFCNVRSIEQVLRNSGGR